MPTFKAIGADPIEYQAQGGGGGSSWGTPLTKPRPIAAATVPVDSSIDPWSGMPKGGTFIDNKPAPIIPPTPTGGVDPSLSWTGAKTQEEAQKIADLNKIQQQGQPQAPRPTLSSILPSTTDEAALREQEQARQRARIDAINQLYVDEYQRAKQRAYSASGQQRGLSASRGTLGSDFGAAEQQQVTNASEAEMKAIDARKSAEILGVMQEGDKTVEEKIRQAKQDQIAAQERSQNILKEQQSMDIQQGTFDLAKEKAKQDIIAAGHKFIERNDGSIVDAMTGNIIAPATSKVKEPFQVSPGATVFDPVSGKPIFTAPEKKSVLDKIVKINGQDYIQDENGNYRVPNVPEQNQQASEIKQAALQSASDLLTKFKSGIGTSGVGFGGNVSRFITGVFGGTGVQDFETQFSALKSQLSLDNVKLLKGQGAVSDAERKLLADASAKLNLNQSEPEFQKALEDIIKGLSGQAQNSQQAQSNFNW